MTTLVRLATSTSLLIVLIAFAPAAVEWLFGPLSTRAFALAYSLAIAGVGAVLAFSVRRLYLALVREQRNLSEISRGGDEARAALDEQRANLGAVAASPAELRDVVSGEQHNLGAVADAVAGLRAEVSARLDDVRGVVAGEQTNLGATAGGLLELRGLLAGVQDQLAEQQTNLGMVAAGVDDLRRSRAGVELTGERYAALSEALIDVAERVDALSRGEPLAAAFAGRPLQPSEV